MSFMLNFAVPSPMLSIVDHPIPYNGTYFTLSGLAMLDGSVDTNVTVVGTWSYSYSAPKVTISPPYQADLRFEPLATDSSKQYTLNVTVEPTDDSPFVAASSGSIAYELVVQRKLHKNLPFLITDSLRLLE